MLCVEVHPCIHIAEASGDNIFFLSTHLFGGDDLLT